VEEEEEEAHTRFLPLLSEEKEREEVMGKNSFLHQFREIIVISPSSPLFPFP